MARRAVPALLAGSLLLCLAAAAGSAHQPAADGVTRYDGQKLVRVSPRTWAEVERLDEIGDIWNCRIGPGPLEVQLDDAGLAELTRMGLPATVLHEDVQKLFDAQRAEIDRRNAHPVRTDQAWYTNYKTLAQIETKLADLATARPDLAATFTPGNSIENRPLRGITITGPDTPGNPAASRPVILWQGCQHAREWVSPMTVTYLAEQLVTLYDTDARVRDLVNTVQFVIVPVVNPDGYTYSWTNARLWRKNRRGGFGVDLNRNWGYQWGGLGASTSTSSDTYRGSAPFSEPETQAIRDLALSFGTRLKASIDYHSYSQLILWPFGYDSVQAPEPDRSFFIALGDDMADAIFANGGTSYINQHSADLYAASGDANDWFYGDRGAKAYTIELRDTGTNGFELPADQILPTARENWAAALIFAEGTTQLFSFRAPLGLPSTLAAGQSTPLSVQVLPIAGTPGTVELLTSVDGSSFAASAMSLSGANTYAGTLPPADCGSTVSFFIRATDATGNQRTFPAGGAADAFDASAVDLLIAFDDDMQTNLGWTIGVPGDTATSGLWSRADPLPTAAQPGDDASPDGTLCFITDGRGGTDGQYDIDGGATSLTSPRLDALDGDGDAYLLYSRWYSNDKGANPNADSMPVLISGDDGATWTQLELVTDNLQTWVAKEFRVADFITPTSQVRVRFVARDDAPGSIVEAGVDEVRLEFRGCAPSGSPADLNGDGVVDFGDVGAFVTFFAAQDPAADLNGDGVIDFGDVGAFVTAFSAATGG